MNGAPTNLWLRDQQMSITAEDSFVSTECRDGEHHDPMAVLSPIAVLRLPCARTGA